MTYNAKHFAGDISSFFVIHDVNTSAKELSDDLKKVNDWAFQCKISFNADPSKQAQEIFTVTNQRDQPTHVKFSTITMSLKPFLKNTWVSN